MRLHFVTIPVFGDEAAEEALNVFLASHRVVSVDRQLIADGARSAWAVCVTWTPTVKGHVPQPGTKRERVDYREVLSPQDFAVFARLRELRSALAQREGVPRFAIFTNEQLAAIARGRPESLEALGKIEGVGPSRVERFGRELLASLGEPREPSPDAPP